MRFPRPLASTLWTSAELGSSRGMRRAPLAGSPSTTCWRPWSRCGLGERAEGVPPSLLCCSLDWEADTLWSPRAGPPWVTPGAGQCSFTGQWTHPPAEVVVGALDLGGASTQITFLPETTIADSSTRALLRLYGTNYSIYTHSYLCYGQKQALKMLMASLHQVTTSSLVVFCCSLRPNLTGLGRQHPLGVTAAGLGAFEQTPVRMADTSGPPRQEPSQGCPDRRAALR